MKEEEGKGEKRGGAGRESEEGEGRRTGIKWGRKSTREKEEEEMTTVATF